MADGVPVIGAGDVPENAAAVKYGFLPHHNRVRIVQGEAAELPVDSLLADSQQGVLPNKFAFVESDGPAEAGFIGIVLRVNIRAPEAIPLFETQCVERPAAERNETAVAAGLPECVPQVKPEFSGRVEFPSKLSHVGQTQR